MFSIKFSIDNFQFYRLSPSRKPSFKPSQKVLRSSNPTYKPLYLSSSFPTSKPIIVSNNLRASGNNSSLPVGGIVGIVIAVVVVVSVILFYFYRTQHMHYVRRFIKIPAFSLYSFLPDDSKYFKKSNTNTDSNRNNFQDYGEAINPMAPTLDNEDEGHIKNIVHENAKELEGGYVQSNESSTEGSPVVSENVVDVTMTNVVKSGYLMKKAVTLKRGWLKRWFFIKDGQLFYTHKHTSMTKDKHIYAVLVANLVISTVRTQTSCTSSSREFQIVSPGQRGLGHGGGVYELMAETDEEATSWIQVIRSQIEGSLAKTLEANMPDSASNSGRSESRSDKYETVSSGSLMVPSERTIRDLKTVNPYCVDCGADNPEWASLNLCVMMCIDCSGVHRNMGTHVSKVRSIKLDKWSPASIELMLSVGNEVSNRAVWESKFKRTSQSNRPVVTAQNREKFIREKYQHRFYMNPYVEISNRVQAAIIFFSAAEKGDLLRVLGCIAAGIDVNVVLAHVEIMQYKSSAPAAVAAVPAGSDWAGKTALALCCKGGHKLCVQLLILSNAEVDVLDNDGLSPLDIAMIERQEQIIEIMTSTSRKG